MDTRHDHPHLLHFACLEKCTVKADVVSSTSSPSAQKESGIRILFSYMLILTGTHLPPVHLSCLHFDFFLIFFFLGHRMLVLAVRRHSISAQKVIQF